MNLKDIKNNNNPLEIQYPLYNYINNNSPVNKRNSEFLVENIKKIYENYPDVELSNLNDPFFNDICSAFTTEEGTDITLNDRRKEYYVNVSLCEINCSLIKVINKDSNPRALCNCEIKQDITFDNQKGESQKDTNQNDNFSSFSSQNIKSFMCISESFNKNISKNVIFWIFIVVMFLQINLLIAYIKNKEMTINKILGLYDNIQAKNKNNVIISNGEDKIIYDFKKKEINTNANTYTNNNFVTDDNKIINSEYFSYPVYVSNPPKKDKGIKGQNIDEAKSDNINKQKSSLTESGSTIKDDDPQVITNISFNDINNKLQLNKIHNNNKDTPLPDLNKNMEEINKALDNQIVTKKYCDTCEDILYSNKNKFDNKNSKKISNILDGQDIFSNHLIENYSDNGDNRRYPKTKNNNEENKANYSNNYITVSQQDKQNNLMDEGNSINKVRKTNNKNVEDLFKERNTFVKPLEKDNNMKEDEKNNDERLKTDMNINEGITVKKELEKTSKGDNHPYPTYENNYNNLLNSISNKQLKIRDKIEMNNRNKELSNTIDSHRNMIKSGGEEGETYGDNAIRNIEKENKKYKYSRNKDSIKDKNTVCSMKELLETENREVLIEQNFFLFFYKYFKEREIWLLSLKDKKETIPYFVRYSSLIFCLSFLFLLNCFFFFESNVHMRYLNALSGNKNDIIYYFTNELITTIYVSLIGNVFKMIIIKLVIMKLFKIGKTEKAMMRSSSEKGLNQNELDLLQLKRRKYMSNYKIKLLVYFLCIEIFNLLIAYICICYGAIFPNSIEAFLYGMLFSLIISFIVCLIISLLIVTLYKCGKCLNCKCMISTYNFLSTLY